MALKVIKPRTNVFDKLTRDLTQGALDDVAEEIRKDFEATVTTWENKPEIRIERAGNSRHIFIEDERYTDVNNGTPPKVIVPVNKKVLRFVVGGKAKTTPNIIGSSAGSKGNDVVFTKRVNHPGIRARNFDKTIAAKWTLVAPSRAQLYLRKRLGR